MCSDLPRTIAVPETPDARVNAAITQYLGQISVINDGHSYIITLRVNSSDPALAVKIANAHARAYLDHQVNSKTASVKDANSSVTAQLDALAEKLKASEEALRSFRDSSALIGPVQLDRHLRSRSRISAPNSSASDRKLSTSKRACTRSRACSTIPSARTPVPLLRRRPMTGSARRSRTCSSRRRRFVQPSVTLIEVSRDQAPDHHDGIPIAGRSRPNGKIGLRGSCRFKVAGRAIALGHAIG